MKNKSFIVIIVVAIILTPMLIMLFQSIIFKSGEANAISLNGYIELFKDGKTLEALKESLITSLIVAIVSVVIGLYFVVNWFFGYWRKTLYFMLGVLTLVPADVTALSVQYCFKYLLGYNYATQLALYYSLIAYVVPYCTIVLMASVSLINRKLLIVSSDLNKSNVEIVRSILFPIIKGAIFSSFVLSVLLCFNEYSRTFYLSGSYHYLSVKIYSDMSSGTNNNANALGGANIITSFIILLILIMTLFYTRKRIECK